MFRNYFTTIFRNLTRNKLSTVINVSGLAVSIACCIAIYVFLKHEYSFDHFHGKADRIHRIVFDDQTAQGTQHGGYTSFPVAPALRNDFPQLETVTRIYVRNSATIQVNTASAGKKLLEEPEMVYADEFFLKTFDFPAIAGGTGKLLSSPDEVVLTKRLADKLFSGSGTDYASLINQVIVVNNNPYRISAVLQDAPRNSNIPFDMLLPFKVFESQNPVTVQNWNSNYSQAYTFVTLSPGYSAAAFDAALVGFKNKYLQPEFAKRTSFHPQPLKEVHTDELYGGTMYASPGILVLAFLAMGSIVLLTACINFINLATAQSFRRAKEIGIRKTLGSSRLQLMGRFLGETFVLTVLASLIALLLANWFLGAFNDYLLFVVDFNLHIDATVIGFLVALSLLITLLAGFYPAKVMSSFQPITALKSTITAKNTGFANRFSLRKALVVVQFVVTQVLIIGTIVVATQMEYFHSKDPGYRKEGIQLVDVPGNDEQKITRLRTLLLSQPGVESVSFSSGPPTSASNGFSDIRLPQSPLTENFPIERKFVDHNYLTTFRIGLYSGRGLLESDRVWLNDSLSRYNVLLNRKAVSRMGFVSPEAAIGQQVLVNNRERATIVGVTEDFSNTSLQQEVGPCLLFYGMNWVNSVAVRTSATDNASLNTFIRKSWESVYPDNVYKVNTLDEYIRNKAFYILEEIMFQGFRIFVGIAIIIGCMGLYGLVAFLAAQRQKEIGIRKVLGSSVRGIILLFTREFTVLIILAFLVAAPLGYFAMGMWLQTFANPITLHAGYFVAAFIISLIVAGITVSFQSVRAAIANPVKSLRSE